VPGSWSTRAAQLRRAREVTLRRTGGVLAATLCSALCAGCAFYRMVSRTQTPAEQAQLVEPRCSAFHDASADALLSPSAVDGVEPAYSYVQSGNDRRANLAGARIHVRPLPGVSPEGLMRDLECHEARVVLEGGRPREDDPYVLPGQWVDLEVSSERDGFVVLARVTSIADARVVLDRAKRFAAARLQ
jgi:hypothetical protein